MRQLTLPIGRFDVVLLPLLGLLILWGPWSVGEAQWVPYLDRLPALAIGGLLVGFVLARTRIPELIGQVLSLLLGLEVLLVSFAAAAPPGTLPEQTGWVLGRLGLWFQAILGQTASNDPILFALAMGALAWLLGHGSAWWLFRNASPWLAFIANGLALLMNLSYAPVSFSHYALKFVLNALVLLAVFRYAQRHEHWVAVRMRIEPGVGPKVLAGSLGVACLVLATASALPAGGTSRAITAGWDRVTAPWRELERDFDRVFASINSIDSGTRGLNFGRTLAPRGAFDLGDTPVLAVQAPRPLYLRATTADRYTGQAITGTEATATPVSSVSDFVPQEDWPDARDLVSATIRVLASRTGVAFVPELPLRISVPAVVERRGGPTDVSAVRLDTTLQQNESYSVDALVARPTARDLRTAGQDYPAWVRERYLTLPRNSLPQRVVDLARQQSPGTTPYDRAVALETYLRQSHAYSTHVSAVPSDRDWVDFFLFEMDAAYCDHFATALVVMLRTQGIPARVASGFAPGERQTDGSYLVRENHAHSWVEVYFPRYGWITFEPSPIRPLPTRPEGLPELTPEPAPQAAQPPPAPAVDQLQPEEQRELTDLERRAAGPPIPGWLLVVLASAAGFLVVALAGLGLLAFAWQRGLGRLAHYQRPFAQLVRLARWAGAMRPAPSHTPYEVAESLARAAPSAAPTIRGLADAYVEGTYAGRPPAEDPWPAWRATRRRLGRDLARHRLRMLLRRWSRRGDP